MKLKIFDFVAIVICAAVFILFLQAGKRFSQDEGYLLIQDESGESLYSLGENRTVAVQGPVGESFIVIEDGTARFEHSDCADSLCVQMGEIHQSGDWAACLPNKVFLLIKGGPEEELDAATY